MVLNFVLAIVYRIIKSMSNMHQMSKEVKDDK